MHVGKVLGGKGKGEKADVCDRERSVGGKRAGPRLYHCSSFFSRQDKDGVRRVVSELLHISCHGLTRVGLLVKFDCGRYHGN